MISTTDSANILYKFCKELFGLPTYQWGCVPTGKITEERVVIIAKERSGEKIWKKNFVEVNLIVPDDKNGNANLIRLNELDRLAEKSLKGTGKYNGVIYTFSVASQTPIEMREFDAHMINCKVLFKVINVMTK